VRWSARDLPVECHDALVNGEAVDRHPEPIVNLRDAYLIEVYLHRANSHRDTLPGSGDPAPGDAAPAYLAHSPRRSASPMPSPDPAWDLDSD
jgi:hypothetical protein